MGGGRIAVYAVVLLLVAALADWGFHLAGEGSVRDADVVYCLAPSHVDGLVDAAVSLGVARRGPSPGTLRVAGRSPGGQSPDGQALSPQRWRDADGAGFQRACDAYAMANMPAQATSGGQDSGGQTVLDILLPVVGSALLMLVVDSVRESGNRRWALADELRDDWQAFSEAARSYADRYTRREGGRPDSGDLDAKRRMLLEGLRTARSRYRRTVRSRHGQPDDIERLQAALRSGELGKQRLGSGWEVDVVKRPERYRQVTSELDNREPELNGIADALERRIWPRLGN
ncbi:MAG: hypothetical protein J2P25_13445 [Nocardiopsaceae bacterium]|nr:hypothetical protein [Nocardiopsaceae bacterium]